MFCNGEHFTRINTAILITQAHHSAHKGRAQPLQPAAAELRKERSCCALTLWVTRGSVTCQLPLSTPDLHSRTNSSKQELAKGLTSHQCLSCKHHWNHQTFWLAERTLGLHSRQRVSVVPFTRNLWDPIQFILQRPQNCLIPNSYI